MAVTKEELDAAAEKLSELRQQWVVADKNYSDLRSKFYYPNGFDFDLPNNGFVKEK